MTRILTRCKSSTRCKVVSWRLEDSSVRMALSSRADRKSNQLLAAGFMMIRQTQVDNVIVTHAGAHGPPDETLVLEKGTMVCVDLIGVREYLGSSDCGARTDYDSSKTTIHEYSLIRTHSSQSDGMVQRRMICRCFPSVCGPVRVIAFLTLHHG